MLLRRLSFGVQQDQSQKQPTKQPTVASPTNWPLGRALKLEHIRATHPLGEGCFLQGKEGRTVQHFASCLQRDLTHGLEPRISLQLEWGPTLAHAWGLKPRGLTLCQRGGKGAEVTPGIGEMLRLRPSLALESRKSNLLTNTCSYDSEW